MYFRNLKVLFLFGVCWPALCQSASNSQIQAEQHLRRAEAYLGQKRPDLAIPELEQVVALDPKSMEAQGNLGVLLFFRGDYADAVPHLRIALEDKSDLSKIQALLGLAEARLGNASTSRTDLEGAFSKLEEAKLKTEVGEALIENYTSTGDLEKAASIASAILEIAPTDTKTLFIAYRLYSDLANKAMVVLAMTAPNSAQIHELMARELALHGDELPAIANYREAIRINPHLAEVHSELGQLLYSSSDDTLQAQAEGEFRTAVTLNPTDEKARLMLGVIAARRGDFSAAYIDDTEAVRLQENDSDACTELGKVLISMNHPDKAQGVLERAVQADPSNYLAHYFLGTLYRRQGRADKAKEQIELYKRYKSLHDNLQTVFQNMRFKLAGRASSAKEDISK